MATVDNCVVIDYGSETIKAGLASSFPSDDCPAIVIPSAVQAASSSGASECFCAVQRGQITDIDNIEALLHHILYKRVGWQYEAEGSVVIAEPVLTPKADREQLCQLLFEQFNVEGLFVHDSAVLSLYAVGKSTGLVVDLGHGKLDIATVFDGATNSAATRQYPFTGADANARLLQLLKARGTTLQDERHVRELKHQCCKIAESAAEFDQALVDAQNQSYSLPDGQQITLSSEGYQLTECLFKPQLLGSNSPSLAELATECMQLYYDGMGRKQLFENILLCGGMAGVPGLQQRLLREVRQLSPLACSPAAVGVAEYLPSAAQRYSAWAGGAIMARIVAGQGQFMTKGDYEEGGPASVHRKCA